MPPRLESSPGVQQDMEHGMGCSIARGVAICFLIAGVALALIGLPTQGGLLTAAPAAALLFGLVLRRLLPSKLAQWNVGADFSRTYLLRAGVILIGLQVSAQGVMAAGWTVLLTDLIMVSSTLLLAWLGGRLLGMDGTQTLLIGAGAAICGTSAVLSSQQVLNAPADQATVAVGTVVAGGLICLAIYPVLWGLNAQAGLFDAVGFGRYVGSTVHEVAQVAAIASGFGSRVEEAALVAKMGRVAMLAPVLLLVVLATKAGQGVRWRDRAPGSVRALVTALVFPSLFVVAILVSWAAPPHAAVATVLAGSSLLLMCAALAGTGLCTNFDAVRRVGAKPLVLALGLLVWLVGGGAWVNASVVF